MFHRHHWEEKSKQWLHKQWYTSPLLGMVPYHQEPATLITMQCNLCKKYKQKVLKGHVS